MKIVEYKKSSKKSGNNKKVTGIELLGINIAMVTTNDSRIRFIDARVESEA
jgi:hypothetical protein